MTYHSEFYNKTNNEEQWVRLSDGCYMRHEYCQCPKEIKRYTIPTFERNLVKIMDMNFLHARENPIADFKKFKELRVNDKVIKFEMICGFDYRLMTQDIANHIKQARFFNVRIAWDEAFSEQMKIVDCLKMLIKAGYEARDLSVFIICNHKIKYEENLMKLDLLKVWNVKAVDCYFDNQISPNIIPIYWTKQEITEFRKKTRKHNQLIRFKIDPEYKPNNQLNDPKQSKISNF